MNRRSFLKMFAAGAAAAATNPVHFLAPVGGWKTTDRMFMSMDWGKSRDQAIYTIQSGNNFWYMHPNQLEAIRSLEAFKAWPGDRHLRMSEAAQRTYAEIARGRGR